MLWQARPGLVSGRGAIDAAAGGSAVPSWDSATTSAVNLTGGDLIATNTGTTSSNQGAMGLVQFDKTTGKLYIEMTFTTITSANGSNLGFGVGTTTSTFTNMGNSATDGNMVYQSGNIWANSNSSGVSLGTRSSGDVIGIAVDLDNHKIWFKKVSGTPGNWNNDGGADPATNVGGHTVLSSTMRPFVTMGSSGGAAGNVVTANFGGSAFTGTVPSGFTSGWS